MALNRRSLLKTLVLMPGLPILNSKLAHALLSQGTPTSSYVLLHGLFFLEFVGKKLFAATPQHTPHHFHIRPHGQPLQPLSPGDLDLSATLGTTGQASSFPTDILQFSASSVHIQTPVLPNITKFQTRIILPLPKLIFAYRSDTTQDFPADTSKNVTNSIFSFAGPRLGTITCLEYDPGSSGPTITSYYAEHPKKVNSTAVNTALDAARDPGFLGPQFDFRVSQGFVADAQRDSDNSLPAGVLGDDEATIEEVEASMAILSFAKTQKAAGIHGQSKTGKLTGKQTSGRATPTSKSHSSVPPTTRGNGISSAQAADIASCPQFGINP